MEGIVEFILELIFEISTDRKISKWIRYPLLVIIISCCLAMMGLFIWVGMECFETSKGRSVISWVVAIFIPVLMAKGFIDRSKEHKKTSSKK